MDLLILVIIKKTLSQIQEIMHPVVGTCINFKLGNLQEENNSIYIKEEGPLTFLIQNNLSIDLFKLFI